MIAVSLPVDSPYIPAPSTRAARRTLRVGARTRPGADASTQPVPVVSTVTASDLDLFRRIAAGDEAALAELYDRHSRIAYSVIMRILRSPSDAEDVLQETFVRVWIRAESYDARLGSPVAWIARIARNRAIDRLRARRVRGDIAISPGGGTEGEGARQPEPQTHLTPELVLQGNATTRALREAMATLPVVQRELIEAAFFEGYTHHELSKRFGVPLGTVKTRIRAGLLAMRGRLEQVA
jgi:RNA polymerase sigma-70 factor (ECF subfamily)